MSYKYIYLPTPPALISAVSLDPAFTNAFVPGLKVPSTGIPWFPKTSRYLIVSSRSSGDLVAFEYGLPDLKGPPLRAVSALPTE